MRPFSNITILSPYGLHKYNIYGNMKLLLSKKILITWHLLCWFFFFPSERLSKIFSSYRNYYWLYLSVFPEDHWIKKVAYFFKKKEYKKNIFMSNYLFTHAKLNISEYSLWAFHWKLTTVIINLSLLDIAGLNKYDAADIFSEFLSFKSTNCFCLTAVFLWNLWRTKIMVIFHSEKAFVNFTLLYLHGIMGRCSWVR